MIRFIINKSVSCDYKNMIKLVFLNKRVFKLYDKD
jgi:hypothetical protein